MGKFSFGQPGVSYECDKVDLNVNEGSPRCPRCGQRVYFNEEKKALGKSWHARCFTCCECKKTLSSTNYNEFNGDIMCTTCHRRRSAVSVTQGASSGASAIESTGAGVAAAAADAADDDDVKDEDSDDAASKSHSRTAVPSRTLPVRSQTVNMQDAECCPQCGRTVYFAEEIKALKRKWHRLCFKCVSCKRTLEPGKCTENDRQLFCHPCHHKRFGPHVLRTAAQSSTSSASSFVSDVGHRVGNGAVAYIDTFETGDAGEAQPTQPIRGTQEWTESFVYDQSSSDYQRYRLH